MNSYTQIDTVEVGEAAPEGAGAGTVGGTHGPCTFCHVLFPNLGGG